MSLFGYYFLFGCFRPAHRVTPCGETHKKLDPIFVESLCIRTEYGTVSAAMRKTSRQMIGMQFFKNLGLKAANEESFYFFLLYGNRVFPEDTYLAIQYRGKPLFSLFSGCLWLMMASIITHDPNAVKGLVISFVPTTLI